MGWRRWAGVALLLTGCPGGSGADAGALEAATCSMSCPAGLTCQAGSCVPASCSTNANCASPLTCAGGFCTDLSCDPPCSSGTTCLGQVCIPEVPETCGQSNDCGFGLSCVGGYCIDSNCHPACPSMQSCLDGVCVPNSGGTCQAPYVLCYDPQGSYCADVQKDSVNCGGCGVVCPSGEVCNGVGVCAVSCVTGESICGNRCVDLQTDSLSCGMCGTACAAGQVCGAGSCQTSCATGEASCKSGGAAYCADTTSDPSNCGACGTVCTTPQECSASICSVSCGAPFTLCGGGDAGSAVCTDTRFDPANCGACGVVCSSSQVCLDSMCLACGVPGQVCCGGSTPCVDGGMCTEGVCPDLASSSVCGNGTVEPGEVCDLGALNGTGAGCNATCTLRGQVTTIAGVTNTPGLKDGCGASARFGNPHGVTIFDGGNVLYLVDDTYRAVRALNLATDCVETIAGGWDGGIYFDGDGPTNEPDAGFGGLCAIMTFDGGLILTDLGALRFLGLSPTFDGGALSTLAGEREVGGLPSEGFDAGPLNACSYDEPQGLAQLGNIIYTNTFIDGLLAATNLGTDQVYSVGTLGPQVPQGGIATLDGLVYTARSTNPGGDLYAYDPANPMGGLAAQGLMLQGPTGICSDYKQSIYICDIDDTIRQYVPATGATGLLAGGGSLMPEQDGLGSAAGFFQPIACVVDPTTGFLYVVDEVGDTIREIQ